MFGAQGLTNSGVQQQTARDMNDLATTMGYSERQMAPQFLNAALQYGDEPTRQAQNLLGIGDIYREYDQAKINSRIQKFEEQRLYPYRQVDVLGNAVRTGFGAGGSSVSTGPGYYQPSRTAGMLGGGLAGYGLGQGTPVGGLGGAALGGLAGMYL